MEENTSPRRVYRLASIGAVICAVGAVVTISLTEPFSLIVVPWLLGLLICAEGIRRTAPTDR